MENKNERTGLIHIYCGDGKGKTTAAIGAAIRAAGRGFRVLVLRLLKTNDSGEVNALQNIPEIHVLPCVRSFGFRFIVFVVRPVAAGFNAEFDLLGRGLHTAEDSS